MFGGPLAVQARFDALYEPALRIEPPPGDTAGVFRATLYKRRLTPTASDPDPAISLLPLVPAAQLKPPEVHISYVADGERVVPMLFEHPTNQVSVDVTVSKRYLVFGHGLLPSVRTRSDGVQFTIRIESANGPKTVFDRTIRPRDVPGDRQFHQASVDLDAWAGERVTIRFLTKPLETPLYDHGAWLAPRLADLPEG
jgi:hypothetical protein